MRTGRDVRCIGGVLDRKMHPFVGEFMRAVRPFKSVLHLSIGEVEQMSETEALDIDEYRLCLFANPHCQPAGFYVLTSLNKHDALRRVEAEGWLA